MKKNLYGCFNLFILYFFITSVNTIFLLVPLNSEDPLSKIIRLPFANTLASCSTYNDHICIQRKLSMKAWHIFLNPYCQLGVFTCTCIQITLEFFVAFLHLRLTTIANRELRYTIYRVLHG